MVYLSYSNQHADLLFELVSRRYQHMSMVVTTNRAFSEWGEVFRKAACVVSLIDRLRHRAEVVRIDGASRRAKEADERAPVVGLLASFRSAATDQPVTLNAKSCSKRSDDVPGLKTLVCRLRISVVEPL
jgi:hypothetical protein